MKGVCSGTRGGGDLVWRDRELDIGEHPVIAAILSPAGYVPEVPMSPSVSIIRLSAKTLMPYRSHRSSTFSFSLSGMTYIPWDLYVWRLSLLRRTLPIQRFVIGRSYSAPYRLMKLIVISPTARTGRLEIHISSVTIS